MSESAKLIPKRRFKKFQNADAWEQRELGDVGSVSMCKRIFKDQTSERGEISFFKIGTFGEVPDSFISRELFDKFRSKYSFPEVGDILISASGTIGRTVVYNGEKAYYQDSNIVWLKQDKRKLINLFLKQFYQVVNWSGIEGSTIKRLYNNNILSTKIYLPSIQEQSKIGYFFKQLDDTIALQQRKLERMKALKSAYLSELFPAEGEREPKRRFVGFTGAWEQRKLSEIKDSNDKYSFTGGPFGSDLKSSDYTETGVRIVQLQNIGDGFFNNDYKIYTSEKKANSLHSNLIYPNEIIIAKMADPLARAAIMPCLDPMYLMASDGIRLKVDLRKNDNYFVLTLINNAPFRNKALVNSSGTTRKRIGLNTLGDLISYVPLKAEQTQIGNFFKQLDDTISLQQRKLEKLQNIKKAYLNEMFI